MEKSNGWSVKSESNNTERKYKILKVFPRADWEKRGNLNHRGCVCTYLLTGGPRCSRGNHGNRGNSAACSKSSCSTWADSLRRMPAMSFLQAGPTGKTTTATAKPWPTVAARKNTVKPQVSRARPQVENPDQRWSLKLLPTPLLLLNVPLPSSVPAAASPSDQPKLNVHHMKGPPLPVHSLLPGPNALLHPAFSTSLSIHTKVWHVAIQHSGNLERTRLL